VVNLQAREPNGEVLAEDLVGLGELCVSEDDDNARVSFGFVAHEHFFFSALAAERVDRRVSFAHPEEARDVRKRRS
jgi:hypothetical protein